MATLLEENVFFMWLSGMSRPDRILEKMDKEGVSDKKLRKAVSKIKEESLPKPDEYNRHLEILGERNSYSKTDSDATFMHMKEDAMNNGETRLQYCRMPQ